MVVGVDARRELPTIVAIGATDAIRALEDVDVDAQGVLDVDAQDVERPRSAARAASPLGDVDACENRTHRPCVRRKMAF